MFNRNIKVLAIAQALGLSVSPLVTLVGGIVGTAIAPNPAWATLPVSTTIIGLALFSAPAALLMKKWGRRRGSIGAALFACGAALLAAYTVYAASFFWFCFATFLLGFNMAFVQQYRFAAAESVDSSHVSRAVSFVLLGSIVAAFLGPEIAKRSHLLFSEHAFAGAFLILAGIMLLCALVLTRFQEIQREEDTVIGESRPLKEIMCQPNFIVASASAAIGYGVMSFIMTATPISMHVMDGFSLADTAFVIQSHIAAMYLPSLFSGFLIHRFGIARILTAGIILTGMCVAIAYLGRDFAHYWTALVFLGVGWNFLYVGGTSLLTQSYTSAERFKGQAANDFIVFSMMAVATMSSGYVIHHAGWQAITIFGLFPLLFLAAVLIMWQKAALPLTSNR
ncbi:MAG: MFS transporter [Gammaproteobacteria bacterium]|nr:MFS transporter [Gammaproteobacteria bacterium]